MRVEIQVTREHIRYGDRLNGMECPVALAIRDLFPDAEVQVNKKIIWFNGLSFPTPADLAQFIADYDRFDPVRPIAFTLDIPEEYQL